MSSERSSTVSVLKQLCSGVLSGGLLGVLFGRGHYVLSYVTFTSIGLIDVAYHLNYFKAHITHLTYDRFSSQRVIRSRLTRFQRGVQRDLRDSSDDFDQELEWLWNDIKRQIDGHIYFGMGFTMTFLLTVVLISKK